MVSSMNREDVKALNITRSKIKSAEDELKQKHPFLAYQSAISILIAAGAIFLIIITATFYFFDQIPAIAAVLLIAFFTSFLHELEHDIFHQQYFVNSKSARNTLLAILWLFKPNTINPWIRKRIHLHHHKYSGKKEDIEERMIGNGLSYGVLRFLIMAEPMFALSQFRKVNRESKAFRPMIMMSSLFPIHTIYTVIWISWFAFHLVMFIDNTFGLDYMVADVIANHIQTINFLMVVYIAPAIWRVFCLQFISSTLHYYGGVDSVLKQTQIFDHWSTFPLQLFCCFFGKTHAVHHVYVNQPFYLRHMLGSKCKQILVEAGTLNNDLGTFKRENHYPIEQNLK
ncbi:hypothetical protein SOPP22_10450 [Shewanella sp. OPT22]|nr:hypothetical protein SOPP22_10450 [Shewanella sp. OPT22]